MRHRERRVRRIIQGLLITSIAGAVLLVLAKTASADLILNAEVGAVSEDNIVGLLTGNTSISGSGGSMAGASAMKAGGPGTGMGGGNRGGGLPAGAGTSLVYTGAGSSSLSDISLYARGELGWRSGGADDLSFFVKGFAKRIDYQTYSFYDQSSAGASAGLDVWLDELLSLRLAIRETVRRYDNDPDRDSTTETGIARLRQRLPGRLKLSETAEYETSRASLSDFNYRGPVVRASADWGLGDHVVATAGYGFRSQQYQDQDRTVLRTRTASLGLFYELSRSWGTGIAYDRDVAQTGTTDFITRNNIFSLFLRFDL